MVGVSRRMRRIVVFSLALVTLLAGAGQVAACPPHISSGPFQTAYAGSLEGSSEVTMRIGAGGTFIEMSFSVGTYRSASGTYFRLRCDTFEPWVLD